MSGSRFFNLFSKDQKETERSGWANDQTGVEALREENLKLRRALEELSILNDLARAIGASLDSNDIIEKIVHRSVRAMDAEQAVITLVDRRSDDAMKTLVRAMRTSGAHERFHLNQNLLGWMHLHKKPLLTNDPKNDDRFKGVKWEESVRSLVCVPLMVKSELIGVLTVYNKKDKSDFKEDDQRLLGIIAAQSAQVIENARLYEEEKAFALMQEQIRLARQIQIDLLPKHPPTVAGYEIAGLSIPAQQVGGDYYDFISLDKHRLGLTLGDVSGKGLPASLLMANLQATLRGQAIMETSVGECISRSNRLLYRSTDPEKFATLFYGVLDSRSHQLLYCNAGHENPLLFSGSEEPVFLATGGLVLGVADEFPYKQDSVSLKEGDLLIIFSDGVSEAVDAADKQFGEEKLFEFLKQNRRESPQVLIDKIVQAVSQHAGDVPQMDDITLIAVKRVH